MNLTSKSVECNIIIKYNLLKKTPALLYIQLVQPHLEYCVFFIDGSLKKHIDKFDRV